MGVKKSLNKNRDRNGAFPSDRVAQHGDLVAEGWPGVEAMWGWHVMFDLTFILVKNDDCLLILLSLCFCF